MGSAPHVLPLPVPVAPCKGCQKFRVRGQLWQQWRRHFLLTLKLFKLKYSLVPPMVLILYLLSRMNVLQDKFMINTFFYPTFKGGICFSFACSLLYRQNKKKQKLELDLQSTSVASNELFLLHTVKSQGLELLDLL